MTQLHWLVYKFGCRREVDRFLSAPVVLGLPAYLLTVLSADCREYPSWSDVSLHTLFQSIPNMYYLCSICQEKNKYLFTSTGQTSGCTYTIHFVLVF